MGERQDLPLPQGRFDVAVVLVGVTHPGNLGAICRTMLNYGFDDLRLVKPKCSPEDGETRARAKHASRLLDELSVHQSIAAATEDCSVVVGTSGKREVGEKTLFRHYLFPWDMVERLSNSGGRAAIVFGEEGKGLSTEDLQACDFFVTLPTWEGYPIANLSHAVGAVVYEIHRTRVLDQQGQDPGMPDIVPLTPSLDPAVREALVKAIDQFASGSSASPERRLSVAQTLRRTLIKGSPSTDECTRMIGALVEATTAMEFARGDPLWKKDHRRKLR
jgi:tRNA/rRNA methyltransferase/tRNA (cytidine32/uridine32-2'-O)-methyltransferase